MNSQQKWFEEFNKVDPEEYKKNIKSSEGIDLISGKWKDPKCKRVAVVCEYKSQFLKFCKANENDNTRLFFHVWSKESTAGYEFDSYIILDEYLERFVDIVDQVRTRIR